jgi:hypothetical protein
MSSEPRMLRVDYEAEQTFARIIGGLRSVRIEVGVSQM